MMKLISKVIEIFVIISFKKNITKPIKIDKNKTLKKFSFLLNLPDNPITTKVNIVIKRGLRISDI